MKNEKRKMKNKMANFFMAGYFNAKLQPFKEGNQSPFSSNFCAFIFLADSKTNIKGKTMLITFLAGCDEIPAYAGMMFAAPLFLFKPKAPSFQRKLESAL